MSQTGLILGACACSFVLGLAVSYTAHSHYLLPLHGWDCVWVTGPEGDRFSELQECKR
jgi:hypothetical protein